MGFIEVTDMYSNEKILVNTQHVTTINSRFSEKTNGSKIHFTSTSRMLPMNVLETLPELGALVCDGAIYKIEEETNV